MPEIEIISYLKLDIILSEEECCHIYTVACIIVNDDQQDATILAYLFIPNQLYISGAMSSPIVRST